MADPIIWYVTGGVLIAGVISLVPTLQVVNRVAPYSYPNARIRARRTRHVSDEQFRNLASRPYADIVNVLERTTYPHLASNAQGDFSYAAIDTALRAHLIEELEWLKSISPQEVATFIDAVLSKYDIQVIETVARAAKQGTGTGELLHKTRLFSREFLLRDHNTLEDLRNELKGTPYESIIAGHEADLAAGRLESLEIDLDLHYFAQLKSAARTPSALRYTKILIDIHNVSLALKGKEPIIPGGSIPQAALKGDENALSAVLAANGYDATGETPEALEKAMQQELKRYGKTLMARDPLSEASIIGYLTLKTINVRNTSILLKMRYHGLDTEDVLEVLAL